MPDNNEHFGSYLLREFLWELEQSGIVIAGVSDILAEQIEVLSYSGYDDLRLQVGAVVIEVRLSWRGDVPPIITQIPGGLAFPIPLFPATSL